MSAATGFSGNRLSREGEIRTEETLRDTLRHPDARAFVASGSRWLFRIGGEAPDPHFPIEEALALSEEDEEPVLLGFAAGGAPRLVFRAGQETTDLGEGFAAIDLRSIGLQGLVDPDVEGQLAQGAHLLNWRERSRFCGRCGGRTAPEAAGYRRKCAACGETVFPRTDPVSIMLVHDGRDRCILGRQPHFPQNFWSCLAGFIEPGETIEDAARREVLEEAGVEVGAVVYLGSQPWPFPGSLMIGCLAEATSFDIRFDDRELEACRWFSHEEARAMLAGAHPDGLKTPQPFAIAHHLIKAFAEGGPSSGG